MTDKTTEALKLAEEALNEPEDAWLNQTGLPKKAQALAAIREALAEQSLGAYHGKLMREVCNKVIIETLAEPEKQEPVIWHSVWDFVDVRRDPPEQGDEANWIPLYASPVSVEAEWIETNKALAKEIIEQRNQYLDMLAEAVDLSVKAEREACAKVCDEIDQRDDIHPDHVVIECAAAIRARSYK